MLRLVDDQLDAAVRLRAMQWLSEQREQAGNDTLSRNVLQRGFLYGDQRVPIVGPRGIFKPRVMRWPLSIASIGGGPYRDQFVADDVLEYAYRGTDPNHPDNAGLREAGSRRLPLIYAFRVERGRYVIEWPVQVVGDDPTRLRFIIQFGTADHARRLLEARIAGLSALSDEPEPVRAYITSTVRRRLHQQAFRERVLRAYREQCALCRLRHDELLDAAHITPDSEERGDPVITNGVALCKLHHAAFDRHFLTIRPDYRIVVQRRILEEGDGPMLQHGLKELEGQKISLPRDPLEHPDQFRLEERYALFLQAG
jgi:putative restriction endonuclease